MPKYRRNSKSAQVYNAFLAGGVDAALAVSKTFNWSGTAVRKWCTKWAEEHTGRTGKSDGPNRVMYLEEEGTVIREGPEQSTVRLDSGVEWHVPNRHLHPIKKKSKPA